MASCFVIRRALRGVRVVASIARQPIPAVAWIDVVVVPGSWMEGRGGGRAFDGSNVELR